MEETRNTLALILNCQPYRENDSLVSVYTLDFGKLSLVARGTKKLRSKLAGHLEPLSLAALMIISGRGRDYVGSALCQSAYLGIRDDLNKLYYAGQALAWFNRLVRENQADERLFFLITKWLEIIDNYPAEQFTKARGELFLNFFLLKFLAELGYCPEMYHCVNCQQEVKPGQNFFDLKSGGILDEPCRHNEALPISDNVIKLIRFILDNRFNQAAKLKINSKNLKDLSQLVISFLKYHF